MAVETEHIRLNEHQKTSDGIWLSSFTAEVVVALIGAALLVVYRTKLGY